MKKLSRNYVIATDEECRKAIREQPDPRMREVIVERVASAMRNGGGAVLHVNLLGGRQQSKLQEK